MVAPNGTPTPPPSGPALPVPKVVLIFRQHAGGARELIAVEIGGVRFGGVVAVDTGVDTSRPSNIPGALVRLNLTTLWPFEWRDETSPAVVVAGAGDMPPEPPTKPRIVR